MPHHQCLPKKWLGEANRINSLIKEDKAKLELSGIKQHDLDSFEARVGAMTWSAAQIITYINNMSIAEKEWDKLKPLVKKARRDFVKALKRAFREDCYLSYAVKRIKDGET